jgi:L-malate glycosyltransferase
LFVSKLIHTLEPHVDLFHCHSPLVPPIRTTHPVMLTFHSTVRDDVMATKLNSWYTLKMKLQAPISQRLEVDNLEAATVVNVVSPRVAEALRKYPHCPQNVQVVWNGVDTAVFKPRSENYPRNGYILTVGRLGPGKGLEDLVDAISLVSILQKETRLIIVGDGPLLVSLEHRVKALGLQDQVHFEGHISDRATLIGYYQQAALFVLPSHHEGMPTVVLEAMACGCPILATNVGGVPNVIKDGVNGVLVPPGEPHRLASTIQTLLKNHDKLNAMGVQARNTIEHSFSWEIIGSKFVDLYTDMQQMVGRL